MNVYMQTRLCAHMLWMVQRCLTYQVCSEEMIEKAALQWRVSELEAELQQTEQRSAAVMNAAVLQSAMLQPEMSKMEVRAF